MHIDIAYISGLKESINNSFKVLNWKQDEFLSDSLKYKILVLTWGLAFTFLPYWQSPLCTLINLEKLLFETFDVSM